MSSSGLFYAYAKNIENDTTARYLIVFANRDVADSWWRVVADSVADGYARFAQVQRISPQFYTHNPQANGHINETIYDEKCARSFMGKVFFTLLNDRDNRIINIAPTLDHNFTDHQSGKGFFIRSVVRPDMFWYHKKPVNRIVAYRDLRTKFVITIYNPRRPRPAGTIMIGTDSILISLISGESVGVSERRGVPGDGYTGDSSEGAPSEDIRSGRNIVQDQGFQFASWGNLTVHPVGRSPFIFSDFQNHYFQIDYDDKDRAILSTRMAAASAGERWELVA